MSQFARTCIAAVIAFMVGCFLCWWFTPEQKLTPARAIRPKPAVMRLAKHVSRSAWKEAPEHWGRPWDREQVILEFSTRGSILTWAEGLLGCSHTYSADPNWCLLLFPSGLSCRMAWHALFYEYAPSSARDLTPWKLRWTSQFLVEWLQSDELPDCAWVEPDSRTLIIATRDGKAVSVSILPRRVRHL